MGTGRDSHLTILQLFSLGLPMRPTLKLPKCAMVRGEKSPDLKAKFEIAQMISWTQ